MICEMCGKEFDAKHAGSTCRGSCGMGKQCAGVRCPYCMYEMLPEPAWITGLKRLWQRGRNGAADAQDPDAAAERPLAELNQNQAGLISRLKLNGHEGVRKLIAIGLLPGTPVELLQKYPACVIRMGESQFSIDHELAALVYVTAPRS